ncbi:unnamed protein product [Cyprideis torosa]|uniref:Uncharacterized protein n=1 Tax=Cyprideis torosa TaxID=163714 RepID=A0A7R8ZG11_9CRUS|nr:unnamed protein product [Cyprideis torosa]CAG0880466.1 unnamed protein product [Cyprideis torosa]
MPENGEDTVENSTALSGPAFRKRATRDDNTTTGSCVSIVAPAWLSLDLKWAYTIVGQLMDPEYSNFNLPFLNEVDYQALRLLDYPEVVTKPMWLQKIMDRLCNKETFRYKSITEVVRDLRLMLENCYRYNGPQASVSLKAQKLDEKLEDLLSRMPEEFRKLVTLQATHGVSDEELSEFLQRTAKAREDGIYRSFLRDRWKDDKKNRDEEAKRKLAQETARAKREEERKIVEWEQTEVMGAENMLQLKHMPEIPMLEHFLQITKDYFYLKEIPIFTLERSIMLPRESSQFAYLMTGLLSLGRMKDIYNHPPMPYSYWSARLEERIREIYKAFFKLEKDRQKMFEQKGVEPKFFDVLGEHFPFRARKFHEMNYYQRAWLLLGFCDYLLKTRPSLKTRVFDVAPVSELRAVTLGVDDASWTYYHFPSFAEGKNPAVRVYKRAKWIPPKLNVEYNPRRRKKKRNVSEDEDFDEFNPTASKKRKAPVIKKRAYRRRVPKRPPKRPAPEPPTPRVVGGKVLRSLAPKRIEELNLTTSESEDELSEEGVKLPEWFIRRKKSEAANLKPNSGAGSLVSEFPDLVKKRRGRPSVKASAESKRSSRPSGKDGREVAEMEVEEDGIGNGTEEDGIGNRAESPETILGIGSGESSKSNSNGDSRPENDDIPRSGPGSVGSSAEGGEGEESVGKEEKNNGTAEGEGEWLKEEASTTNETSDLKESKATKEEGEPLIEGETEKEEEGGEREIVKEEGGAPQQSGENSPRPWPPYPEPLPEVEPDKTFECVADSLDSLRELVKHFESKGSELSYTETALVRKLKALIEELEPSEYKLVKSTRSLRTLLHADFMKFQRPGSRSKEVIGLNACSIASVYGVKDKPLLLELETHPSVFAAEDALLCYYEHGTMWISMVRNYLGRRDPGSFPELVPGSPRGNEVFGAGIEPTSYDCHCLVRRSRGVNRTHTVIETSYQRTGIKQMPMAPMEGCHEERETNEALQRPENKEPVVGPLGLKDDDEGQEGRRDVRSNQRGKQNDIVRICESPDKAPSDMATNTRFFELCEKRIVQKSEQGMREKIPLPDPVFDSKRELTVPRNINRRKPEEPEPGHGFWLGTGESSDGSPQKKRSAKGEGGPTTELSTDAGASKSAQPMADVADEASRDSTESDMSSRRRRVAVKRVEYQEEVEDSEEEGDEEGGGDSDAEWESSSRKRTPSKRTPSKAGRPRRPPPPSAWRPTVNIPHRTFITPSQRRELMAAGSRGSFPAPRRPSVVSSHEGDDDLDELLRDESQLAVTPRLSSQGKTMLTEKGTSRFSLLGGRGRPFRLGDPVPVARATTGFTAGRTYGSTSTIGSSSGVPKIRTLDSGVLERINRMRNIEVVDLSDEDSPAKNDPSPVKTVPSTTTSIKTPEPKRSLIFMAGGQSASARSVLQDQLSKLTVNSRKRRTNTGGPVQEPGTPTPLAPPKAHERSPVGVAQAVSRPRITSVQSLLTNESGPFPPSGTPLQPSSSQPLPQSEADPDVVVLEPAPPSSKTSSSSAPCKTPLGSPPPTIVPCSSVLRRSNLETQKYMTNGFSTTSTNAIPHKNRPDLCFPPKTTSSTLPAPAVDSNGHTSSLSPTDKTKKRKPRPLAPFTVRRIAGELRIVDKATHKPLSHERLRELGIDPEDPGIREENGKYIFPQKLYGRWSSFFAECLGGLTTISLKLVHHFQAWIVSKLSPLVVFGSEEQIVGTELTGTSQISHEPIRSRYSAGLIKNATVNGAVARRPWNTSVPLEHGRRRGEMNLPAVHDTEVLPSHHEPPGLVSSFLQPHFVSFSGACVAWIGVVDPLCRPVGIPTDNPLEDLAPVEHPIPVVPVSSTYVTMSRGEPSTRPPAAPLLPPQAAEQDDSGYADCASPALATSTTADAKLLRESVATATSQSGSHSPCCKLNPILTWHSGAEVKVTSTVDVDLQASCEGESAWRLNVAGGGVDLGRSMLREWMICGERDLAFLAGGGEKDK